MKRMESVNLRVHQKINAPFSFLLSILAIPVYIMCRKYNLWVAGKKGFNIPDIERKQKA